MEGALYGTIFTALLVLPLLSLPATAVKIRWAVVQKAWSASQCRKIQRRKRLHKRAR